MDKTAIRNFAIEARKILMKSAITEAGFYGITKDGCKDPVQKGNDFEVYETVAGTENRIFGDDIKRRANLVQAIKTLGFEQVIEETAYTWFNRIIAIRFMEVNNYLPTRVRVLSSETGSGTPDIITQADTVELNLTSDELEKIQTAKRENRYDDAFRMLFIKQCNELNAILPGLFEKTDDYMELLLKITYTGDGIIRMLVDSIPEDNFNVETEGQVEIIGWMYQYYNTELKDDTFAKLKKNVKITKERIPAATQLFTPDWIVRYMVENSLGRVWIEHLRAVNPSVDEKAKAEEFGWKYYLPEAEQEDEVQAQLVEIRKSYKDLTPQDITCIDPCMGSGHILVYMFDVLMDIYRSEGFSEREAVFDILEKNIRGLDIDRRAYQLSYFALMMKARGYNRIFFRGHEDAEGNRVQAMPRVYAIEESNSIDREQLKYFGAELDELSKNNAINQMNGLLDSLYDAKEYGSILSIENYNWELLRSFMDSIDDAGQGSLFGFMAYQSKPLLDKLINIGEVLSNTYDAVVTNPPYMGNNGFSEKLSNFVKEYFPDSKVDMFSVFIERCRYYSKNNGFYSMITQPSLVSLTTFEKLRLSLVSSQQIYSFLHMGRGIFGIDFGSIAFSVRNMNLVNYKGTYFRLHERTFQYIEPFDIERLFLTAKDNHDFRFDFSSYKSKEDNELDSGESNSGKEILIHHYAKQDKFKKITGTPFAYWLSDAFLKTFDNDPISVVAKPRQGLATGDNDSFLRMWFEVDFNDIGFGMHDREEAAKSGKKWFPCNKGGDYRKWFGNNDYVVDWENDGFRIRHNFGDNGKLKSRPQNMDFYFREGMTWSTISSKKLSMRYSQVGSMFETKGSVCFPNRNEDLLYLLGLMNTSIVAVIMSVLSPTIDYHEGPIGKIPVIFDEKIRPEVNSLVQENIQITKEDWNDRETSVGFEVNPIVRIFQNNGGATVKKCVEEYIEHKKKQFNTLKKNEERLNQLFISLYGLEEEMDYRVEPQDVSIRIPEEEEIIKELISYAVGCMLGRYSHQSKGILMSIKNNEFSYNPDADGILPITDESYFEDDVVEELEKWLGVVFKNEDVKDNLTYIAENLGIKGNRSAKDTIRDYFVNSFYKEHCERYSITGSGKRPIYWLFDSGKQNGFKCLVYLHRYNPNTVGLIRSDYLTKAQSMIENAQKNAEYAISNSSSAVDRAQATKKRDKYVKQLAEIRSYYPALSHIALQRIELNLDDGVKANYAKFQGIEVSVEGEKKQKIDLLAKI